MRQINENIFSLILRSTCKYVSFLARFVQMAADFTTTYFEGKTQEFVGAFSSFFVFKLINHNYIMTCIINNAFKKMYS